MWHKPAAVFSAIAVLAVMLFLVAGWMRSCAHRVIDPLAASFPTPAEFRSSGRARSLSPIERAIADGDIVRGVRLFAENYDRAWVSTPEGKFYRSLLEKELPLQRDEQYYIIDGLRWILYRSGLSLALVRIDVDNGGEFWRTNDGLRLRFSAAIQGSRLRAMLGDDVATLESETVVIRFWGRLTKSTDQDELRLGDIDRAEYLFDVVTRGSIQRTVPGILE